MKGIQVHSSSWIVNCPLVEESVQFPTLSHARFTYLVLSLRLPLRGRALSVGLSAILCCINYCGSNISVDIWEKKPSCVIFFFRILLTISVPLFIHINFRINLPYLTKKKPLLGLRLVRLLCIYETLAYSCCRIFQPITLIHIFKIFFSNIVSLSS